MLQFLQSDPEVTWDYDRHLLNENMNSQRFQYLTQDFLLRKAVTHRTSRPAVLGHKAWLMSCLVGSLRGFLFRFLQGTQLRLLANAGAVSLCVWRSANFSVAAVYFQSKYVGENSLLTVSVLGLIISNLMPNAEY